MSGSPDLLGEFLPGRVGVGNFKSRPNMVFTVLTTSDVDDLGSIGSERSVGLASTLELRRHKVPPNRGMFGLMGSEIRTMAVSVSRGGVSSAPSSTAATG